MNKISDNDDLDYQEYFLQTYAIIIVFGFIFSFMFTFDCLFFVFKLSFLR